MFMNGVKTAYTCHFLSDGEKTNIQIAMRQWTHSNPILHKLLGLMWRAMARQWISSQLIDGLQKIKAKVEEDVAAGKIVIGIETAQG